MAIRYRPFSWLPVLALAAAAANAGGPPAATATTMPPVAAQATPASDALSGLHRPRPDLLTGGQPGPDAWRAAAAQGVTTVINLRTADELPGRDEAAEVAAAGLAYRALPVAGIEGIDEDAARTLWHQIESAPGTVLVHCASGNRVGALLAIGAAREGGMPAEEAIAFGRAAGLGSAEARVREVLAMPAEKE